MIRSPIALQTLLLACAFAAPTVSAAGAAERVLLVLGDSLSAAYGIDSDLGWVALLQRRIAGSGEPIRVVNASISGETTIGGLTRLPELIEAHRPSLVLIALGANDGLRGFGFDSVAGNLRRMVALSKVAGAETLLAGIRLPPNYGAAYTDGFQATFREVAESEGVPLVPRLLADVSDDRSLMQPDELHPTAEAQPLILDNVWPVLAPILTHMRTRVSGDAPPEGGASPDGK